MSDLDKVYVSSAMLQRELGVAATTAKGILDLAEKEGDVMMFDSKKLYNRSAVNKVLRNKHSKLLKFLGEERTGE